jgi:hypothetical protein
VSRKTQTIAAAIFLGWLLSLATRAILLLLD